MQSETSNGAHSGFFAYRILRHAEYGQVVEFKPRALAFGKNGECATKTLFTEEELINRIESLKATGEDSLIFEHALRDLKKMK